MNLGGFQFSLDTAVFDELRRSTVYNWPDQPRIGANPALQYTGTDPEVITLPGRIFPHFRGGLSQLDAMRAQGAQGKPLLLVDGLGSVKGFWCITKVDEGRKVLWGTGAPRLQEFSIELKYFGPNGNDTVPKTYPVTKAATGTASTTPLKRSPVQAPARGSAAATSSVPAPQTPDTFQRSATYTLGALGPVQIGVTVPT